MQGELIPQPEVRSEGLDAIVQVLDLLREEQQKAREADIESELLGNRDINAFVMKYGRLPRIGDPVPPWRYRGWCLWYAQLADSQPWAPQRWTYYMETFEAGKLLDKPIPQIRFGERSKEAEKCIDDCIDLIFHKVGSWSAFPAFIDWLSWGLATSKVEPKFDDELNEKLYRRFNLEHFLMFPHDYLGHKFQEGKGRWNPNAFYATPHTICEFMCRMTMGDPEPYLMPDGTDKRLQTVMEPAVGTGRFLLHASNYSLLLYGMDIDATCVAITKINGALYAPWMTFPFPASITGAEPEIRQGNTLLDPMVEPAPKKYSIHDHGQGLLFEV